MRVIDLLSEKLERLANLEKELADFHMPLPPRAVITATLFDAFGEPKLKICDIAQTWNYNYYKFAGWVFIPPELPGHVPTTGGNLPDNFTVLSQDGTAHRPLPMDASLTMPSPNLTTESIPNTTNLTQGILIGSGERTESSLQLMTMPQMHTNPADFIVTIQSATNAQLRYDTETRTWYKKLWKSYQNIRDDKEDIVVREIGLSKRMLRSAWPDVAARVTHGFGSANVTPTQYNDQNTNQRNAVVTAVQNAIGDGYVIPDSITSPIGFSGTVSLSPGNPAWDRVFDSVRFDLYIKILHHHNTTHRAWFMIDHTKLAEAMTIKHNELLQVNYDITLKVG